MRPSSCLPHSRQDRAAGAREGMVGARGARGHGWGAGGHGRGKALYRCCNSDTMLYPYGIVYCAALIRARAYGMCRADSCPRALVGDPRDQRGVR